VRRMRRVGRGGEGGGGGGAPRGGGGGGGGGGGTQQVRARASEVECELPRGCSVLAIVENADEEG